MVFILLDRWATPVAMIPVTDNNNARKRRNGSHVPRDSLLSDVGDEIDSSALPRQNQKRDVDLYSVLADSRRRRIVFCLAMSEEHRMTTKQLGSHLRSVEDDTDPLEVGRRDSTTVRHSIKRHHLPKLTSLDIVEVDREVVRAGERFGIALSTLCFVESNRF